MLFYIRISKWASPHPDVVAHVTVFVQRNTAECPASEALVCNSPLGCSLPKSAGGEIVSDVKHKLTSELWLFSSLNFLLTDPAQSEGSLLMELLGPLTLH